MKTCSRCGIDKPATAQHYHKNKQSRDGLHAYCKDCRSNIAKEYRRDPEVYRKIVKTAMAWNKTQKGKAVRKKCDTSLKRIAWRHKRAEAAREYAFEFCKKHGLFGIAERRNL